MAQEISPTEERVYDPLLGEERDAFPGEVVDPEKEKTLNSLMRKARETFANQFDPVIATGQLNEDEINAIQKAANIKAELERKEYLDAIHSNPANIIKGILKECNPEENNIVRAMLFGLNNKVKGLERNIASKKTSDQLSGKNKNTLEYIEGLLRIDSRLGDLLKLNFYQRYITVNEGQTDQERPPTDRNSGQIVFETLKKLGLVPIESLRSFDELFVAVRDSGNTAESGKPYVQIDQNTRNLIVKNISSSRPGLEGIRVSFTLSSIFFQMQSVAISGTPEALARIVDRGQYVPYQQPEQQLVTLVPKADLSEATENPQGLPNRVLRLPKLLFLKQR